MNKRIRSILLLFLISSVLIYFFVNMHSKQTNVMSLLNEAKLENISRDIKVSDEIERILYNYDNYQSPFSKEQFMRMEYDENLEKSKRIKGLHNNQISFSKTDIKSDIEIYFDLLKDSYAAYNYFGGDEIFLPTKEKILNKIENYELNNVPLNEFKEMIISEMSFIRDNHFIIDSQPVLSQVNQFIYVDNKEKEFYRDEKGYYAISKEGKDYVKKIEKIQNKKRISIPIDDSYSAEIK